jgi:hypothetical protein
MRVQVRSGETAFAREIKGDAQIVDLMDFLMDSYKHNPRKSFEVTLDGARGTFLNLMNLSGIEGMILTIEAVHNVYHSLHIKDG